MLTCAEVWVESEGDRERLREMTNNGWRVVSMSATTERTLYLLERVPTCYPAENKEHARTWAGGTQL